jgi:WD40 repeat protein
MEQRVFGTARTGELVTQPLQHGTIVRLARFSPDGQLIVTASEKCARIWQAETGEPVKEELRHLDTVQWARVQS